MGKKKKKDGDASSASTESTAGEGGPPKKKKSKAKIKADEDPGAKAAKADKAEKAPKAAAEKGEKPDKPAKADKAEKPDKAAKADKGEEGAPPKKTKSKSKVKAEEDPKAAKAEKPDKAAKADKGEEGAPPKKTKSKSKVKAEEDPKAAKADKDDKAEKAGEKEGKPKKAKKAKKKGSNASVSSSKSSHSEGGESVGAPPPQKGEAVGHLTAKDVAGGMAIKKVKGGAKAGKVVKAPGMEGEGFGLQLEEAEVLPYESVFEWDLQDPVGYYAEDDKYQQLTKVFEKDDIKTAVLDGMWRDRIKYQVLRRFIWTPPLLFKQAFFSRGYYEDYESRPTVDIQWMHLGADRKRQKQEAKNRKAGENRMNFQLGMNKVDRKDSLSEFDPMVYKREVLVLTNLPKDITEEELKKLFPKGTVELQDDGKGGKVAFVKFKNFEDSRQAYRLANKTTIRGKQMAVRPLMHSEDMEQPDSLTGFDPLVYNLKVLVLSDLPSCTTKEELEGKFPNAIVTLEKNGKGGFTAQLRYKELDHARAGYKYGLTGKDCEGNPFKIRPILHINDLGRKDSLSEYDPRVYQREVLVFRDLPKDTPIDFFKKLYPNGIVELIDDGKGGVIAEVEFKSFDESRKAFKTALKTKFKGKDLKVMPKLRPRGSLSLFDPRIYNREILTIRDLPKGTSKDVIAKMFPKGTVVMKDNGKGGQTAEVTFKNFTDARAAYRHGLKSNINGKELKIIPKLRKDHAKDMDFLHKMKKDKPPPPPVVTGQKTSLSEFDPLVYNRQVLTIKSIPKGVSKAELDKMFPNGSVEIKSDGKGGSDVEIEFKSFDDARMAFRNALKSKLKGQPINILPILRVPDSGLDGVDRGDVQYANPYMIKSKIQAHPLRSKTAPKGQKPKTTKRLNQYDPREFDYQTIEVTGIPMGTNKMEVTKTFAPRGKIESLEPDFKRPGQMMAIVTYKSKEDAMYSYIDNHEQPMNGRDIKMTPKKLDVKKKVEKGEAMPEVPKSLTQYNASEYDYQTLIIKKIPIGSNKQQVQVMFKNGKVTDLKVDPLNKTIMVATVTENSKDEAVADYKNAIGKKLNGNEIVVVPAKFSDKK